MKVNFKQMKYIIYRGIICIVLISMLAGCDFFYKEKIIYNPVLPGDYPNPTVIKVKDYYYASATSNEWSPLFPIFKSKDLNNWELVSYVFPGGAPEWADKNFWSPELIYDETQDRVYAYYSARDKNTHRMSVAVASADSPEKPFTDHGPLVSQEVGSIDPFEIKDRDGKIYVIWKEDGSSAWLPTPIWAQQINEDRNKFIGDKVELIRNDQLWEEGKVEGVCLFEKGDYFYMFYSSGLCCEKECNYKVGVARAKNLLGPWEKFNDNPILRTNVDWKCPGQGSVVEKDGDLFLLYHAYSREGSIYVGRQGVLEKIMWSEDKWPEFNNAQSLNRPMERLNFLDQFHSALNPVWQWRVTQDLSYSTGEDGLMLSASTENDNIGSLLVQSIHLTDYQFIADIDLGNTGMNSEGGICLIGAEGNYLNAPLAGVGISASHDLIKVWKSEHQQTLIVGDLPMDSIADNLVKLKMEVERGHLIKFYVYNKDAWQKIDGSVDVSPYVPWGMGLRFGVVAKGLDNEFVNIKKVELKNLCSKK